jgi:hypothetical protein
MMPVTQVMPRSDDELEIDQNLEEKLRFDAAR